MNINIQSLYERMQQALRQATAGPETTLEKAGRCIGIATTHLTELKDYISAGDFGTIEDEIEFFKEVKPSFHKELIFWSELIYIESHKPLGDGRSLKRYGEQKLKEIEAEYGRYRWLDTYRRKGSTYADTELFLRQASGHPLMDEDSSDLDGRFTTVASHKLSRLLALTELTSWIQVNYVLASKIPEKEDQKAGLVWTGSKAQLIELVYALESYGVFNNGKTNVKEVMEYFQYCFGVDKVANYYGYFQGMRIRKKDRTPFLNGLVEQTIRRMDESDEFPRFAT